MRLGPSLAAVLFVERRVLARRGWAGENRGLFERPAYERRFYPVDHMLTALAE